MHLRLATLAVAMPLLLGLASAACTTAPVVGPSLSASPDGTPTPPGPVQASSPCGTQTSPGSYDYAVRHDPPPYYTTLRGCSSQDVPYSQLARDLAHSQLPAFSFITPNLIDDMHDGTVADGDTWLAANLPKILASPQYRNGSTAVFITWDEGEGGASDQCATNTSDIGCRVPTIVISPSTPRGTRSAGLFNHYSLLATAEELLRLSRLGQASNAATMTAAFRL